MMICGVMHSAQWRPNSSWNVLCSASPSSVAEQLRQQLDSLRKEEDGIRGRANSSRLRFLRLAEAVEKLRRQASISVRTGMENDARDLLFQKKKLMQVMEKLKTRIETFDELSEKLNQAISMKEGLLIENMALDLDTSEADVRIVSAIKEHPYPDFIQQLDQQLSKIEREVDSFIKLSTSMVETEPPQKALLATEILETIRHMRKRIADAWNKSLELK